MIKNYTIRHSVLSIFGQFFNIKSEAAHFPLNENAECRIDNRVIIVYI